MRLFCVIGNEVCRYTESPGLALRVEIPFSSTTPMRVPAGTKIYSFEPAPCAVVGGDVVATGGGADVCGRVDCWAYEHADKRIMHRPRHPVATGVGFGLDVIGGSLA